MSQRRTFQPHCSTARSALAQRVLITTFLLLCCAAGLITGCSKAKTPNAPSSPPSPPSAAQVSGFASNAGVVLPPSAQPMAFREEQGMDSAQWLQVKMPRQDLQGFLEASPFRNVTLKTRDAYLIGTFDRLMPNPPASYRAAQQQLPKGRVLNMVIDDSDASSAIVYLMWHAT